MTVASANGSAVRMTEGRGWWDRARRRAAAAGQRGEPSHPLVPAPVLDSLLALGIAALGLVSGLGARAQGERVPPPALAVLTAMGLVLIARRRFPGAVLLAIVAGVTALVLLRTTLEGA